MGRTASSIRSLRGAPGLMPAIDQPLPLRGHLRPGHEQRGGEGIRLPLDPLFPLAGPADDRWRGWLCKQIVLTLLKLEQRAVEFPVADLVRQGEPEPSQCRWLFVRIEGLIDDHLTRSST